MTTREQRSQAKLHEAYEALVQEKAYLVARLEVVTQHLLRLDDHSDRGLMNRESKDSRLRTWPRRKKGPRHEQEPWTLDDAIIGVLMRRGRPMRSKEIGAAVEAETSWRPHGINTILTSVQSRIQKLKQASRVIKCPDGWILMPNIQEGGNEHKDPVDG